MSDECLSCYTPISRSGGAGHFSCSCKEAVPKDARSPDPSLSRPVPPDESDEALLLHAIAVAVVARALDDACGLISAHDRRRGRTGKCLREGWNWLYTDTPERRLWFRLANVKEPPQRSLQAYLDEWARRRVNDDPRRRVGIAKTYRALVETSGPGATRPEETREPGATEPEGA